MMSTNPYLSVVIPLYHCEPFIKPLLQRLNTVCKDIGNQVEVILVEDGSLDNSWQQIQTLQETFHTSPLSITALKLSRNFGQHAAITAGLAHAKGDFIVVMDGDLQDPPEVIPQLLATAHKTNAEIVFTTRQKSSDTLHAVWRSTLSRLYFACLQLLCGTPIDPNMGCFSLMSQKVCNAYLACGDVNRHYLFVLYWLGFRHTVVSYEQPTRPEGEAPSAYTLKSLLKHALSGLFFQQARLLYGIVWLGFLVAAAGFVFAVALIVRYWLFSALPGWTSLIVVQLLTSGMGLSCLGVVGLYVGRVFEQVKARPLYVIDETLS